MRNTKVLNSYFHLKAVKTPLAICNTTGIAITCELPFIPNKQYNYINPLAFPSNARSLGEIGYSNGHDRISPQVISGCILSLLVSLELIEDKLSAIERNILLCEIPIFHLSLSLRFLASVTEKQAARLPHLSLDITENKESTIFICFTNYIKQCKQILQSDEFASQRVYSSSVSKIKQFKHTNFTPEMRAQAKQYVTALILDDLISPRLASVLKIVCQKDNLLTMAATMRSKLIEMLSAIQSDDASNLVTILKDIDNQKTPSERILLQQLDASQEMQYHADSNIPSLNLSLKEILDRKANPEKYLQTVQEQYEQQEQQYEDENYALEAQDQANIDAEQEALEQYIDTVEDEEDNTTEDFIDTLQELNNEIEQEQELSDMENDDDF